jgi:DNA-binding CsgD family transcriptional regulator
MLKPSRTGKYMEWIDYLTEVANGERDVDWLSKRIKLSPKETDALLAVLSSPYKPRHFGEVASKLYKGESTIKAQLGSIYKKWDVNPASIEELYALLKIGLDRLKREEVSGDSIDTPLISPPTPIQPPNTTRKEQLLKMTLTDCFDNTIQDNFDRFSQELKDLSSDQKITITLTTSSSRGGVVIAESYELGIDKLCYLHQNGLLNEILGFVINDLKILDNQACRSNDEEDNFSRELVRFFRSMGMMFVKLSDIKNIVKASPTLPAKTIVNRLLTSLRVHQGVSNQTKSCVVVLEIAENDMSGISYQAALKIIEFRSSR